MKTLIQGGYVVAFDGKAHKLIEDGVVVFEDDEICYVGRKYTGHVDRTIEARGMQLISPGFVDCESVTGIDIQGFATDAGRKDGFGPAPWNFAPRKSQLDQFKFHSPGDRGDDSVDKEGAVAAEFGTAMCLRSGITTVVGTSSGSVGIDGQDAVVEAVDRLGVRAYLALPFQSASYYVDDDGTCHYHWDEEKARSDMQAGLDFCTQYEGTCDGRVNTMVFPYRLDACTPEILRQSKAAARELNVPVRIHVAQFLLVFYEIIRRHAKTPVQFLADLDFLGPEVLLHHCIFTAGHSWLAYVDDGVDVRILADSGVSISHSPVIFARRSVALESFHRYREAGINVAIGTDTFPPDMMLNMRWASIISKIMDRNVNVATAGDVFNAATLGGAKALRRDDLGRLAEGAKADIAIIDLEKSHIGPVDDPLRALVHCANLNDVTTVIVGGKTALQDGQVLGLSCSEPELLEQVQQIGLKIKRGIVARDWAGRTADEIFPPSLPPE